mgnify:CR=1 FL=1
MKLLKRKDGNNLLEYLLLAVLSIVVYAEVLPTLSMLFELVRTWLASKITIIQQYTVHTQEDIQNTQARIEPNNSVAIGFHAPPEIEVEEEDYE